MSDTAPEIHAKAVLNAATKLGTSADAIAAEARTLVESSASAPASSVSPASGPSKK